MPSRWGFCPHKPKVVVILRLRLRRYSSQQVKRIAILSCGLYIAVNIKIEVHYIGVASFFLRNFLYRRCWGLAYLFSKWLSFGLSSYLFLSGFD